MMMMTNKYRHLLLYFGWVVTFNGCQLPEQTHQFDETHIYPSGQNNSQMPRDATHGFTENQPEAPSLSSNSEIQFETPAGWEFIPGSGMRAATFRIPDKNRKDEATIVILPNTQEDYASNIHRWLGQLKLKLDEAGISQFIEKRIPFITPDKLKGAFFDFTILNKTGSEAQESMLAAIIESNSQVIFVKLMGPQSFVKDQKNNFLQLAKSVHFRGDQTPKPLPPTHESEIDNITMKSDDPAFNTRAEGVATLKWKIPAHWKSLPASGMRTANFAIQYQGKKAEGNIIQLPGAAGGVKQNVRRWMEQIGIMSMTDANLEKFLAKQKKVKTKDGHTGIIINLANLLSGDLTQNNSLAAAIITTNTETIFIKMIGPKSVILHNLSALSELASSLQTGH